MKKLNLIFLMLLVLCSCEKDEGTTMRGQKYVDLGLPSGIKWAKMNIGATDTLQVGDYFGWGETAPHSEEVYSKPNIREISGTEFDAAHELWGGKWRMPTKDDFEELFNYCTYSYEVIDDKGGYLITGTNGNTIFLPNTGYLDGNSVSFIHYGYYWTSTNNNELRFFKSREIRIKSVSDDFARAIRPVCD